MTATATPPAVAPAEVAEVAGDQGVAELAAVPAYPVNVTGKTYRYDPGGPAFGRAVYEKCKTEDDGAVYWLRRAELPYVHARIVLRDAGGRRTGTEYLASATEDGPRLRVTEDDLALGTWATRLGVELSSDRAIITAAGTAVRHIAHRDAPEREATPRADATSATGHLVLPPAECLPDGYLRLPPGATPATVRAAWAELAPIVAGLPKMALTLGASAASPFVGPLRRQSHWWDLYGDKRKGKSTAAGLAASVWGSPDVGQGIVLSWDTSPIGTSRHLGQLGILPPFLDERGTTPGQSDRGWGELIYATCQGASRLTAEPRGTGTRRSSPWFGVLFSNGNGKLTTGHGAGRYAGVTARVIELEAPFTVDAEQSEHLNWDLLPNAYGWLGGEILARYTVAAVRELIEWAAEVIPPPAGGGPRTIAQHLHTAVAGAAMVDAILGPGSEVAAAAIEAARAYMADHAEDTDHDADLMAAALADAVAARPAAWPTVAEYAELRRARPADPSGGPTPGRTELAQHGYDHESAGLRSDDGGWLYVRPVTWAELAGPLGVDTSVALAELDRRGMLHTTPGDRKRGQWTARSRGVGSDTPGALGPRLYHVRMSALAGSDEDQGVAGPAGGPCPRCAVPGESCGTAGVAEEAAPCVGCGEATRVRSRCGVARKGVCRGPAVPAPPAPPAPPAEVAEDQGVAEVAEVAPPAPPAPPAEVAEDQGVAPAPRRGAHPAATARRAAQADRLAADIAALAAGKSPRIADALEKQFAPVRMGRRPFWRPELPGPTFATHLVSGYGWERPYAGPVAVLDRTGAFVASASSVTVAHGQLEHTPGAEFAGRPGLYLVSNYPWHEDGMPHPLGDPARPEVWVPAPTVSLLRDLAEAGRWPDATVADSYTGDPVRLADWAHYVRDLRAYAIEAAGRDSDEYERVKVAYGQALAMLLGSHADDSMTKLVWKCLARRPDWNHAIQAQSAATLWRVADECRQLGPDSAPVALRNVDELVIPAAALVAVTTVCVPGRDRPPVRLDEAGIQLGTFGIKARGEWGTV